MPAKSQRASAVLRKLNVEKLLLQPTHERGGRLGLVFHDKNIHENRTVYGARFLARNAHMNATLQGTVKLRFGFVGPLGFEPLLPGSDQV